MTSDGSRADEIQNRGTSFIQTGNVTAATSMANKVATNTAIILKLIHNGTHPQNWREPPTPKTPQEYPQIEILMLQYAARYLTNFAHETFFLRVTQCKASEQGSRWWRDVG